MRRVLVPKDALSFRRACQLDPVDGLLLNAMLYEIGPMLEAKRRPAKEGSVFSYRFAAQPDGTMFAGTNPWHSFWEAAFYRTQGVAALGIPAATHVAVLDITDFYNQVYHHPLENQLREAGVPGAFITALLNLVAVSSEGVSRGVPTGPHASNFLAEAVLIPLDDYLALKGFSFCRFVDDIFIFCSSAETAQNAVFEVADFLDKTQKLYLNKQKTEILTAAEFTTRAKAMLIDNPINKEEEKLLRVLGKHGGPYTRIRLSSIDPNELSKLQSADIEAILAAYLAEKEPNYIRLRWFLRRLAQTGLPSAVAYTVNNLQRLLPAIGDAAAYLNSASENYSGGWLAIGDSVLSALEQPVVTFNDYLQLTLLSLFGRVTALNHLDKLVQRYPSFSPLGQREILLASGMTKSSVPWLQILKTSFSNMEAWQRRAYLFAIRQLPKDERRFWIDNNKRTFSPLEAAIAAESKLVA